MCVGGQEDNVPLIQRDTSALEGDVGEAAANTTNLGQGEVDLLATINVGVEDTQNVLEIFIFNHDRLTAKRRTDEKREKHFLPFLGWKGKR